MSTSVASPTDLPGELDAPATGDTRLSRPVPVVLADFCKLRLVSLVVMTTFVGFVLAGPLNQSLIALLWTLLGTSLAAAGANAMNQCLEWSRDARMTRTSRRPIPAGELTVREGWAIALTLAVAGPVVLWATTNALTALLAALTTLIYVAIYTPLKPLSSANTLVGAVCGAIPPLLGWTAVTNGFGPGAWTLAAILFVWQLPHFLALAWMYRADYARGGYCMLPREDPDGRITRQVILLTTLLLIPLTLRTPVDGLGGWMYAGGALALGLMFLLLAVNFARDGTDASARRLFLGSIVYLPLLLTLMVLDHALLSLV